MTSIMTVVAMQMKLSLVWRWLDVFVASVMLVLVPVLVPFSVKEAGQSGEERV